ncbi:histidine phosphotransferase family protein [Salipiger profundus]|uniref:histidine phosphotransferase family protein n=1 Tax=Salipiger profundus TaxID=1229727 RepID=UPI0008E4726E|nr:histidine phosphotransferase family protein [Salipiger profundus]SFD08510.1 histidine phosphotransferase ChpT [Salipiger profundus]
MSNDSARIATLVGSRLCHDLVSPVGAISNGLELIALAGAPGPDEIGLIEQSCASATARINLFRVAFGHASLDQQVGAREAAKLLSDYCLGSRLQMDWQVQGDSQRTDVQLACLAALCCETALPLGGRVQITESGGRWRITATGQRLATEPVLWSMLETAQIPPDLSAARVQFACLAMLAPERGRKLTSQFGDAAASIEIA